MARHGEASGEGSACECPVIFLVVGDVRKQHSQMSCTLGSKNRKLTDLPQFKHAQKRSVLVGIYHMNACKCCINGYSSTCIRRFEKPKSFEKLNRSLSSAQNSLLTIPQTKRNMSFLEVRIFKV